MDPAREADYLRMALESPMMLCSEAPEDVLEATTDDDVEPSEFVKDFLERGYTRWVNETFGPVPISRAQINNAVLALWVRARRLHTSHLLSRTDPDWDKPFFSDEGLYD